MSGWGAALGAITGIAGGWLQQDSDRANSKRMIRKQEEFARYGLDWKIQAAKRNGIHPLAVLGANQIQFSPFHVGGGQLGESISRAGQNLGAAIDQANDPYGREMKQIALDTARENLKAAKLQSQGIRMDLRERRTQDQNTGLPGQGNVEVQDKAVPPSSIHDPSIEKGITPLYQHVRTAGDRIEKFPSQEMAEVLETQWVDNAKMQIGKVLRPWIISAKYYGGFHKDFTWLRPIMAEKRAIIQSGVVGKNEDVRWSVKDGYFQIVTKKHPNDYQLFVEGPIPYGSYTERKKNQKQKGR